MKKDDLLLEDAISDINTQNLDVSSYELPYGLHNESLSGDNIDTLLNYLGINDTVDDITVDKTAKTWESVTTLYENTDGQWHLLNNASGGWDINVITAWQDYTGEGVVVGVVDSGIQYSHSELSANYDATIDYDFLLNNSDGANKTSSDNHGTAVAGTIAAANNGTGSTGVAYDATITSFRLISNGYGINSTMFQNVFSRDVDISNNSWGWVKPFQLYSSFNSAIDSAFDYAVSTNREGLGTIIVFAAGNDGDEGNNANYDEMSNSRFSIVVGADNPDGSNAYFSVPGTPVLITAPGTYVYTTDVSGSAGYASGNYATLNGTSFATPIVSGVVALMLDANPGLGYRDVQEILAYSASKNDPEDSQWEVNGAHNWNGGGLHVNEQYGYGFVDATAAVRLAETWFLIDQTAGVRSNEDTLSFTSATLNQNFDNTTYQSTINVSSGLDIDHVELRMNLTHSRIQDLTIELISPDGTNSLLFDRPPSSNAYGAITTTYDNSWSFSSTHHWGETGVGTWTLRITDNVAGYAGTLTNWTLTFYGDQLDSNDTYFYTNEYAGYTGAQYAVNRNLSDLSGIDTINASVVTSNLVINLDPGSVNTIAGNTQTITIDTTIENVIAGDGNDLLTGNSSQNIIWGGRGNDTLDGGAGDDTMYGGKGDDVFYVNSINDIVIENANEGSDIIYSTLANYILSANVEFLELIGDFTNITGSANADTLYGSSGSNQMNGAGGNDNLFGQGGDDTINGGGGNDNLLGGLGNDFMTGDTGNDTIDGGLGNDRYIYSNPWGLDTLTDAGGIDLLDLSAVQFVGVTVNLNSGVGNEVAYGSNTINWNDNIIENVQGGSANDSITGNSSDNNLYGNYGIDTIWGGGGNDSIEGGAYGDTLNGDDGNDTILGGSGNDTMSGGAGDDTYVFTYAWHNDLIIDTGGIDTLDLSGVQEAKIAVAMKSGAGAELTYGANYASWNNSEIENIILGPGGDLVAGNDSDNSIIGNSGMDTLSGGLGNDTLDGGGYADILNGGAGNDILIGGSGNDVLNGDDGDDRYLFGSAWQWDTITDTGGRDTLDFTGFNGALIVNLTPNTTAGQHEAVSGSNTVNWAFNIIENVVGGSGNDIINGNLNANELSGGEGNDNLIGNDGYDTLSGGLGNDTLNGGSGNDTYTGFIDTFGVDIITDASGSDTLDLASYLLANVTSWLAVDGTDADAFVDRLLVTFSGGNSITIMDYFNNTNADDDLSGAGTGYLENIIFSDDSSVNFSQVLTLIA